jgi:leucyl-tRNA synthetase
VGEQYLVEDNFSYPISFNGKTRMQLEFPIALDAKSVEAAVLANPEVQQRLEGQSPQEGDRGAQAHREHRGMNAGSHRLGLRAAEAPHRCVAVVRQSASLFGGTWHADPSFALGGLALSMGFAQKCGGRPHRTDLTKGVVPLAHRPAQCLQARREAQYVLHYGFMNAGEATVELKEADRDMLAGPHRVACRGQGPQLRVPSRPSTR